MNSCLDLTVGKNSGESVLYSTSFT